MAAGEACEERVLPRDVEEDQTLDVRQRDVPTVHLQPQFFVEAPGGADLLQSDLNVHPFVMEPKG